MADRAPRWPELLELSRHRVLAFLRQPEAIFWVFAFPLLLSAALGFAFQSREPAPSLVGVIGESSEGWVGHLERDALIEVVRFDTPEEANRRLAGGHLDAVVLSADPPVLRLDPARAEAELARLRVLVAMSGIEHDAIDVEEVTEHGARYVDFLFPGLLGMSLMSTGLWAIGFAVADMRQRKVLKRLLVTPMRRTSFLASFLTSRLCFLVAELALLTAFGVWVLGVPLRTDLVTFGVVSLLGTISFSAVGLLAASRARTIEGVSGLLNLVIVPMWIGSGVFFSYERFPEAVHPFLRALPLTALNDALRSGMIDGAALPDMLPEMAVMAVWAVVSFAVALRIFRWS
ncbi:MAG TPA: ABC transporter permease [Longimicrobiales bacterium]|nr:ABC transporter permease [Longimicrobiales bacterium]